MTREDAAYKLGDLALRLTNDLYDSYVEPLAMAIKALHQPEPITLTYDEKCIFLSAIGRERRICQEMDAEDGTIIKPLVPIVDTIIRKVKAVLWDEDNAFMTSVSTEKNGKWIPIKTRPLNDEEIKLWAEQHGCKCEEYGEGDDYMCDGYMCLPPLPREGEKVLVCDASGNIDFYTYHFASQFELGMYDEEDEDRPVAWMPLPEPWKGEQEECTKVQ